MQGTLRSRQKVRVMSTGRDFLVEKVGIFTPRREDRQNLSAGDVGFIIAGIKEIDGAPVGDTLTRQVIERVQTEGVCFAGGARWREHWVMRLSVISWPTTEEDGDRAVEAILDAWRACRDLAPG